MNTDALHAGYANEVLRGWQAEGSVEARRLVYPLFISPKRNAREPVASMPGQCRWGVDRLEEALAKPVDMGLRAVLLFGTPAGKKDETGSAADREDALVVQALPVLRKKFPDLLRVVDVCLCAYTRHGHCAILKPDGSHDDQATDRRLADVALAYARAGAQVVAPSDMMDGRVGSIKQRLRSAGLEHVAVMSYASKFASCFYGPFREAARSKPAFGDRQAYQLPPAARRLALRAVQRDLAEGADFVMVKPAGPYLDIIREVKNVSPAPVAAYQVSGEYAMLLHAARKGVFDLRTAAMESLNGIRRAGADILITYFAPQVLEWLKG